MACRAAIFLSIICSLDGAGQVVDFPCVPKFRVDPSHIHVSEASGGQMLLLDRTEIANPVVTRAQMGFSGQTILRASGTLGAGFQEFTAPVDSSVRSLQFIVFAECVKTIEVTAPSGVAVEGAKLSSGRIVFVDAPELGLWRVKLAGTGYFSAVTQGKGGIVLGSLTVAKPKAGEEQSILAHLSGPFETAEFRILSRRGATLRIIPMTQSGSEFQGVFTPPGEPFRLAVEGNDSGGAEFRRVHAPLLDSKP